MTAILFFAFPSGIASAEEKWAFLPPEPLWRTAIGDPWEPRTGLVAHLDQNRYEGLIGSAFELVRHIPGDGTAWGWGLFGSGQILLEQYGASFPMLAGDWEVGTHLVLASGPLSHRFSFKHQSSHLGDSLQDEVLAGGEPPLFFSREALQYSLSFHPTEDLRLLGGVGNWLNMAPLGDPWFASLGFEAFADLLALAGHPLRAYAAGNLRWAGEDGEAWGKVLQAGLQWKLEGSGTRAIRLAAVLSSGPSQYGQFQRELDEHWGLGLYFDP